MEPPGQAEVLLRAVAGRSGVAGRRCTPRCDRPGSTAAARRCRPCPALLEVEVAVERAVEQLGQEARLAVLQRQAERLEIPAVLAVPGRGQRLRASPTLSVGRLRRARISSRRTPASGSSAIGEEHVEMARRRRAAAWPRVLVFDLAVLAARRGRGCGRPARGAAGRPGCTIVESVRPSATASPAIACETQRARARSIGLACHGPDELATTSRPRPPCPAAIRPRRAASCVATTGDFRAAIRPATVAKSCFDLLRLVPLRARPGRSGRWSGRGRRGRRRPRRTSRRRRPSRRARRSCRRAGTRGRRWRGRPCTRSGTRPRCG